MIGGLLVVVVTSNVGDGHPPGHDPAPGPPAGQQLTFSDTLYLCHLALTIARQGPTPIRVVDGAAAALPARTPRSTRWRPSPPWGRVWCTCAPATPSRRTLRPSPLRSALPFHEIGGITPGPGRFQL
jgi:hypothetical protein